MTQKDTEYRWNRPMLFGVGVLVTGAGLIMLEELLPGLPGSLFWIGGAMAGLASGAILTANRFFGQEFHGPVDRDHDRN